MVIIRRFECALEATKDAVVVKYKQNPNLPAVLLCQVSKYPFYDEAVKKKLSEIIDEINAVYNKNFDVDVTSKSALQVRDIMLKNGHLRDSARNNSLKDFRFAYFDVVQDALIAGYEWNQDFLLSCSIMMKRRGNLCRYSWRMCIRI